MPRGGGEVRQIRTISARDLFDVIFTSHIRVHRTKSGPAIRAILQGHTTACSAAFRLGGFSEGLKALGTKVRAYGRGVGSS